MRQKQWYKFYRPAIGKLGSYDRPAIEEMIYPKMEFVSDAEANKYARWVLGHNCFANALTEAELQEKLDIEAKFSRVYT